jgi:hypothetical protein
MSTTGWSGGFAGRWPNGWLTITRQQRTAVLGLLGIQQLEVTGHGSAQLLIGIREGRP